MCVRDYSLYGVMEGGGGNRIALALIVEVDKMGCRRDATIGGYVSASETDVTTRGCAGGVSFTDT